MKREVWQVMSLDVWGNEKDGFELNNIHETGFFLSTLPGFSDIQKTIEVLKRGEFLGKRFKFSGEFLGDDMAEIIYCKTGAPVCQLRRLDDAKKTEGRWFIRAGDFPLHPRNAIIYKQGPKGNFRKAGKA